MTFIIGNNIRLLYEKKNEKKMNCKFKRN